MRRTSQASHSRGWARPTSAALATGALLLIAVSGCGRSAPGGHLESNTDAPASTDDGPVNDTAPAPDACSDAPSGAADAGGDSSSGASDSGDVGDGGTGGDAAVPSEHAWLATQFDVDVGLSLMNQALRGALNANAAGQPAGTRLILLIRYKQLTTNTGQITYGLGEALGTAGPYRFLAPGPTVRDATRVIWDDGTEVYDTNLTVTTPWTLPLTPGGADPASVFTAGPMPESSGYRVAMKVIGGTVSKVWLEHAYLTRAMACPVWAGGLNLLDVLDGEPTLHLYGSSTGTVNFTTCACRCTPNQGWELQGFAITAFEPVELAAN